MVFFPWLGWRKIVVWQTTQLLDGYRLLRVRDRASPFPHCMGFPTNRNLTLSPRP